MCSIQRECERLAAGLVVRTLRVDDQDIVLPQHNTGVASDIPDFTTPPDLERPVRIRHEAIAILRFLSKLVQRLPHRAANERPAIAQWRTISIHEDDLQLLAGRFCCNSHGLAPFSTTPACLAELYKYYLEM